MNQWWTLQQRLQQWHEQCWLLYIIEWRWSIILLYLLFWHLNKNHLYWNIIISLSWFWWVYRNKYFLNISPVYWVQWNVSFSCITKPVLSQPLGVMVYLPFYKRPGPNFIILWSSLDLIQYISCKIIHISNNFIRNI